MKFIVQLIGFLLRDLFHFIFSDTIYIFNGNIFFFYAYFNAVKKRK